MNSVVSAKALQLIDGKAYYKAFSKEGIRNDGREFHENRGFIFTPNFIDESGREPSCLIECGDSKIICSITLSTTIPTHSESNCSQIGFYSFLL